MTKVIPMPVGPCHCQACALAGCTRPPILMPAHRGIPARELHGVELQRQYEAMDKLRATMRDVKDKAR